MASQAFVRYPSAFHFEIRQCDILKFLESLPDESIDLFVTDPPYPSLEKHREVGTTTRLQGAWFSTIDRLDTWARIFRLFYGALKWDRHAYIMCDQPTYRAFFPMLEAAGFTVWKALVWKKPRIGMGYHYRAQHELILFAEKGKRRLADLGVPDVLEARLQPGERLDYGAQKPVGLGQILIGQSAKRGELVCDPFMGSGSFGVAALHEQCAFIGNDAGTYAYELSSARLACHGTPATFRLRGQPRLF